MRERERKSGQHSTEQTRQTETPHREGVEIVQKKTVWSQRMELTICGGNPCSGKQTRTDINYETYGKYRDTLQGRYLSGQGSCMLSCVTLVLENVLLTTVYKGNDILEEIIENGPQYLLQSS